VHKHINSNFSYQSIIKNIVNSYFEGLKEIIASFKNLKTYVYNIVPPIEVDSTVWDNPEFPFLGTNEDRKKYVLYFNECIAENCKLYGFGFFDIYNKYINANGFLEKIYSDGNVHIKYNLAHHYEFIKQHKLDDLPPVYYTFDIDYIGNRILMRLVQYDLSIKTIIDTACENGMNTTLGCLLGVQSRLTYLPINIISFDMSSIHIQDAKSNWNERPGREIIQFFHGSLANPFVDNYKFQEKIDLIIIHQCTLSDYDILVKLNPRYFIIYGPHTHQKNSLTAHEFSYLFQDEKMAILKKI